jgi:hypothetical protein
MLNKFLRAIRPENGLAYSMAHKYIFGANVIKLFVLDLRIFIIS